MTQVARSRALSPLARFAGLLCGVEVGKGTITLSLNHGVFAGRCGADMDQIRDAVAELLDNRFLVSGGIRDTNGYLTYRLHLPEMDTEAGASEAA